MKHPKKKPAKQKCQTAGRVAAICDSSDNPAIAGYYSRHSRWRPYKRKNRHPRISLPVNVFAEWRRMVYQAYPKPETQILEDVVKATELLYARMISGEITIVTHASNVEPPLSHAFLLTRVLLTEDGELDRRNIWVSVTPEAYSRARNVARFTDMPINVVFSIAIYLGALFSRSSTAGLKAFEHLPFSG